MEISCCSAFYWYPARSVLEELGNFAQNPISKNVSFSILLRRDWGQTDNKWTTRLKQNEKKFSSLISTTLTTIIFVKKNQKLREYRKYERTVSRYKFLLE